MDPYLEQFWGDIHTRFMVYACDRLNDQLPAELQARVEESLTVDLENGWRTVYTDVRVVQDRVGEAAVRSADLATVAKPCFIPLPSEPPTQRHVEIVDPNSGGKVITVLELLNPANKIGESGRRAYREKQREYLDARVNLVEIDLLREGAHLVAVPDVLIPAEYRKPYLICVRRAAGPRGAELYHASLREPLPAVRIPLRETDPDAVLSLQSLIGECYQRGRYATIDYHIEPVPRLSDEDERWTDPLLRGKGLR
jgi:hypothetical protein